MTRGVHVRARGSPSGSRAIEGAEVPVGSLDITLLPRRRRDAPAARGAPHRHPVRRRRRASSCSSTTCSSRAARSARRWTRSWTTAAPRASQLAVLVDRGHRELPIRADFVGKNVPTSRRERVKVLLAETDGRDAVEILEPVGEGE